MFDGMLPNCAGRNARRAVLRSAMLCAAVATLDACTKDQPVPRVAAGQPPVTPVVAPVDSTETVVQARWNPADGSAIYIPGDGGVAQVILPPVLDDSVPKPSSATLPSNAAPASVDLFAPTGRISTVSLAAFASASQPNVSEGCDAWPVVALKEPAGTTPRTWRLALQAGVGEPVHTDSIGALMRSDSAQLVVEINRAAALLPMDSAGLLRRVPFSVTKAYRLVFAGNVDAVIAVVERRLNMEASPKVERTVLVLERPPKTKDFNAVWRDTQYATEDDLIAVDLLAVVTLRGTHHPAVFLGLDFGDGSRVQMLQRTDGGLWSLRWSSAYTGC
jgi:hypothetical protein